MTLQQHWPLFGLRIRTPRLELRIPDDHDLAGLLKAAQDGIHDPASTPFANSWTDAESPEFERNALRYWWRGRSNFTPEAWDLTFAVVVDDVVVGAQNLISNDFPRLRVAATGSWLTQSAQGVGLGKEMRRAALHFAFESLQARAITSSAFRDNEPSQRVSLAVGYEPNGLGESRRRTGMGEVVRFRIDRAQWEATRTDFAIEVVGFDECAQMFEPAGLSTD